MGSKCSFLEDIHPTSATHQHGETRGHPLLQVRLRDALAPVRHAPVLLNRANRVNTAGGECSGA